MRFEKVAAAIDLARMLAGSADGLTIDEIAAHFQVSRRTSERMRNVVEASFGPLDRVEDGRRVRFRLSSDGIGRFALAPTAEEMAELANLARALKVRDPARAQLLESLASKVSAALRADDRRRLAPDIELLLKTEVWAHTVGPSPVCAPEVLKVIRAAALSGRMVEIAYRTVGSAEAGTYRLTPYGLIVGTRHYLVAGLPERAIPHLLRLDRIDEAAALDVCGCRPADFDLQAYAERSFGFFQEEPQPIRLIFHPPAAEEARNVLFHPRQQTEELSDGSLLVSFDAGGLIELARYLERWAGQVTVTGPEKLVDAVRSIECPRPLGELSPPDRSLRAPPDTYASVKRLDI